MPTIIVFITLFIIAIAIASKIPGLELLVRPVLDIVFSILKALGTTAYSWVVVAIKTVLFSHLDYLKHLLNTAEALDPTYSVRED